MIENEKEIARNSDRFKGKPANIVENALKGIVNKFYSEVCLISRSSEPKQSITDIVKACERPPETRSHHALRAVPSARKTRRFRQDTVKGQRQRWPLQNDPADPTNPPINLKNRTNES